MPTISFDVKVVIKLIVFVISSTEQKLPVHTSSHQPCTAVFIIRKFCSILHY